MPLSFAHAHASDNWRISVRGTTNMGRDTYEQGQFRFHDGGVPYASDNFAWGPDGGYGIIMFADRRGFAIRPGEGRDRREGGAGAGGRRRPPRHRHAGPVPGRPRHRHDDGPHDAIAPRRRLRHLRPVGRDRPRRPHGRRHRRRTDVRARARVPRLRRRLRGHPRPRRSVRRRSWLRCPARSTPPAPRWPKATCAWRRPTSSTPPSSPVPTVRSSCSSSPTGGRCSSALDDGTVAGALGAALSTGAPEAPRRPASRSRLRRRARDRAIIELVAEDAADSKHPTFKRQSRGRAILKLPGLVVGTLLLPLRRSRAVQGISGDADTRKDELPRCQPG